MGFLSYHSHCWQLLLVGSREIGLYNKELKTLTVNRPGGLWCCQPSEVGAHSPSSIPALWWFRYSGRTAAPQFLTQHSVSAAGRLPEPYANETSWGFDCRGEGAEGSSKVTGLVESWISCQTKMYWAPLQQCFAAVKWSVLYFSEWRFYSVSAVVL